MIGAWATQRYLRLLLGGGTLVSGFTVAGLLLRQSHFALATGTFAISLAALVGAGKQASP